MPVLIGDYELSLKIEDNEFKFPSGVFRSFTIYEDLVSFVPTYTMVMQDAGSFLTEILPLTTGEKFEISFTKDDVTFDITAILGSMDYEPQAESGGNNLIMNLYDKRLIGLNAKTRQEKFVGTTSEIAQEIAEILGTDSADCQVEESAETIKLTVPGWTYGQVLTWLASHSKSSTGAGNFVAFWDKKGVFTFKSLSKLYEGTAVNTLELTDIAIEIESGNFFVNHNYTNRSNNFLNRGGRGIKGSVFNWNTGEFVSISRKPFDTANKGLASKYLFKDTEEDEDCAIAFDLGIIDDIYTEDFYKAYLESFVLSNVDSSVLLQNSSEGNWDYAPGKVVDMSLPSPADVENDEDSVHSGKWLMESVTHIFEDEDYMALIIYTRNSMNISATDTRGYPAPPGQAVS